MCLLDYLQHCIPASASPAWAQQHYINIITLNIVANLIPLFNVCGGLLCQDTLSDPMEVILSKLVFQQHNQGKNMLSGKYLAMCYKK